MSDGAVDIFLQSRREEIERLVDDVNRFTKRHDIREDDANALHLVLDELVINIVRHGYGETNDGTIQVRLERSGDTLTVVLKDGAPAFDPTRVPEPDLDQPLELRPVGGLGIHIVRSLVDAMTYRREGNANVLTLTKALTSLAAGEHDR